MMYLGVVLLGSIFFETLKQDIQVQEAKRVPKKLDPKRTTLRHIIIKVPKFKDKEKILKAAREK